MIDEYRILEVLMILLSFWLKDVNTVRIKVDTINMNLETWKKIRV